MVALCHAKSQQNNDNPLWQIMAVDGCKQLQMSLFSCKMWLCLTSSGCRQLGSVECNQGVSWSQLVLYLMPLSRRNVLCWFQLLFLSVLSIFVDFLYAFETQMIWASFSLCYHSNLVCTHSCCCHPDHMDLSSDQSIWNRGLFYTVIKSILIGCGLVMCQHICSTNSYKYSFF